MNYEVIMPVFDYRESGHDLVIYADPANAERLTAELGRAHADVRAMLVAAAEHLFEIGAHAPVVTHIERSEVQHIAIYGGAEKASKVKSPHTVTSLSGRRILPGSRAIDLRSTVYTAEQLSSLESHINQAFPRSDGRKSLIIHDVGRGRHIHLQCEARWPQ